MSLIPETLVGRGEPSPESHPLTHECILGHEHTHTQHTYIQVTEREEESIQPSLTGYLPYAEQYSRWMTSDKQIIKLYTVTKQENFR